MSDKKDKKWEPKLPSTRENRACVVCGIEVTEPPFVASKPRRGRGLIIAHTHCIKTRAESEAKA